MALNDSLRRSRRASRWLLLLRLLGLTGFFAGIVGGVLMVVAEANPAGTETTWNAPDWAPQSLKGWGMYLAVGGGALALLSLLVEIGRGVRLAAGRRGAFGLNVALQIALAALLLAGVNYFSFSHYRRWDLTSDQRFTLTGETRDRLSQLRGETTIVVYQRHKTFGQLSDKPDIYDYAAERKVVEKVKDLVDQFRELGPQFRVVVLDVEEEGYNDKLEDLTRNDKDFRRAIEQAPENSIFFYADGKVQRLGFHDIYQLDKKASEQNNDGQGNLVLLDQGVEPFARKLLYTDEKKPRVAVATIHEVLSLEGSNDVGMELGMRGVKKALSARGFDTRDILLKKWNEFTGPEPAVLTYDENKYERLDAQVKELDAANADLEKDRDNLAKAIELWRTASLDDLTKRYADQLEGQRVTEALRARQLAYLQQNHTIIDLVLGQQRAERTALAQERGGLNVESLAEQRRIPDLKAKTDRLLADCDLVVIPRLTLINVARSDHIPNRVYRLDDAQVAAIKDFLKAGKPVLALLGPPNEPPNSRMGMDPFSAGPDKLEEALADLGFRLPKQTVLFNVEIKSFAERRGGLLIAGANVEVPPVRFDWPEGAGLPPLRAAAAEHRPPNPIRESMRLSALGLGKDQSLELRVRHPRPVYYEPAKGTSLAFDPVFMMSDPAGWNEDQPFPTRERTPRFKSPDPGDRSIGTLEEKRQASFPLGVAVETAVPAAWYDSKDARPARARAAVIGSGGLFVGETLPPAKEELLLDVCNWLLGRDDLLTQDRGRWKYPRVNLSTQEHVLWQWGTRLGLPVLFAYLGLMVLLVRRLR